MYPDGNAYTCHILNKYENCQDNLEQLCLADFASFYDYTGKSKEEQEGISDTKSYIRSVSYVDKNHGKIRKLFNSKME